MIYLPLHRSHLDYVLITFILWNYDIRAPFVAAGDNMDIPFFRFVLTLMKYIYIIYIINIIYYGIILMLYLQINNIVSLSVLNTTNTHTHIHSVSPQIYSISC